MKRTMIMTVVAAAFAFPIVATAGGKDKSASANGNSANYPHATQAEAFKSMDKNADGFISMEEANGTAHSANFASLDTNGDGKLSQKEVAYTKNLGGSTDLSSSTSTTTDQPAAQPGARADGVTTSTPNNARISKGN